MAALTPRQRIVRALNHQEPDRVPLDVGGTFVTGINIYAYDNLKSAVGITKPTVLGIARSGLAELPEELLTRLESDVRGIQPQAPDTAPAGPEPDGTLVDAWGVRFVKPPEGHYYVREPVLSGPISIHDLRAYAWPDPTDPGWTRGLADKARALRANTDYAIALNLPVGFIHQSQFLRGFEAWMTDLAADPVLAEALLDHVFDRWLEVAVRMLREAGEYADVVLYGDDVAQQRGLLISPQMYRRFIKPRQAKIWRAVHELTKAKVLYHCCGSAYPVIGDLIDIGLDILNPVQVSALKMEPAQLKREFGQKLSFWGAIDTHDVLPHGTPDDVRAEVRRRVAELGQDGGYVIASVHNIQREVPPANILAMCELALRERQRQGQSSG